VSSLGQRAARGGILADSFPLETADTANRNLNCTWGANEMTGEPGRSIAPGKRGFIFVPEPRAFPWAVIFHPVGVVMPIALMGGFSAAIGWHGRAKGDLHCAGGERFIHPDADAGE